MDTGKVVVVVCMGAMPMEKAKKYKNGPLGIPRSPKKGQSPLGKSQRSTSR